MTETLRDCFGRAYNGRVLDNRRNPLGGLNPDGQREEDFYLTSDGNEKEKSLRNLVNGHYKSEGYEPEFLHEDFSVFRKGEKRVSVSMTRDPLGGFFISVGKI